MADPVESLYIEFGGDDTHYKKSTEDIIKETEVMTAKVEKDTTDMVNHVVTTTKASQAAIQQFQQTVVPAAGPGGIFPTSGTDLGGLGGGLSDVPELFSDLPKMKEELAELIELEKKMTKGGFLSGLSGVLLDISPLLASIHPQLGMATAGLGVLGEIGAVAALGLGTFAIALTGTTYAISGWEGVMEMPANLLEGLKIILAEATFGLLDYTAGTLAAAEGEKQLAQAMASSADQARQMLQERAQMFRDVGTSVQELTDHSVEAEEKFIKDFIGAIQQTGPALSEFSQQSIAADIARMFEAERISDSIEKLERQAETYKMNRRELMEHTLATNNATEAEREHVNAILSKMEAIDAAEAARKQAEKDEQEATRAAKKFEDEQKRAQDKLKSEGDALHKAMRTPMEKIEDEAKRTAELFAAGAITLDDYKRKLSELASGPKQTEHKLRLVTESDIGIKGSQFGSADDFARREAYLANRTSMAEDRMRNANGDRFNAVARGVTAAGANNAPVAFAADKREERQLLMEIRDNLANIASNTGAARTITVRPAALGRAG